MILTLKEARTYYTENISKGNYPISLKLAQYLYDLCWETHPQDILDRGSGFSSFVFRRYAMTRNCVPKMLSIDRHRWLDIYTVDKKEYWLNKTKDFIAHCGLKPYGYFLTWADFTARDLHQKKYDLILEDYSFPDRPKSLNKMVGLLKDDGYLVLDDVNIKKYKNSIIKVVRDHGLHLDYLITKTRDRKGRYSALIRRK